MRDGPVLKAVAEVVKDQIGKAFASLQAKISGIDGRLRSIEVAETVKALGPSVGDIFDLRATELKGRIDDIESQIKSLPKPEKGEKGDRGESIKGDRGDRGESIKGEPGKDAEPVDIEKIIKAVVAQIPVPKNGEPGKNGESIKGDPGKDAPAVDEEALATKILSKIPIPKDGTPGKDAPLIDQDALVASILAKIPVPANGLPGKDAPPVDVKGMTYEVLEKVLSQIPILISGEVSKAVSSAVNALPKPENGRKGDTGIPGRDALDIDILEGIDESASYQRGTYAHHRGGTLKAYRTTDPIQGKDFQAAGWQVIQEGIADAGSALAADEQTVVQSLELTSGKLLVSKFEIPTLIHKGIWKSDQEYKRGNFVTTAGSTWHCNEVTKDRPGVSRAWTLVVKRGSDGRDATLNGAHQ